MGPVERMVRRRCSNVVHRRWNSQLTAQACGTILFCARTNGVVALAASQNFIATTRFRSSIARLISRGTHLRLRCVFSPIMQMLASAAFTFGRMTLRIYVSSRLSMACRSDLSSISKDTFLNSARPRRVQTLNSSSPRNQIKAFVAMLSP